ncbi:acylphosphatase [Acinetobacter thermotolerans]|nr:acylphosphatase [Acinetobacter sp. HR7]
MQAVKLTISGKVQKVGYRNWFEAQALELGLNGYVRNLPTGQVEAVVVGEKDKIQMIIQRSWKEPSLANVENIESVEIATPQIIDDFKIVK